jgi:hypothetical protein
MSKSREVKCDARKNLPNAYITFNPGVLDDEKWYVLSYISVSLPSALHALAAKRQL